MSMTKIWGAIQVNLKYFSSVVAQYEANEWFELFLKSSSLQPTKMLWNSPDIKLMEKKKKSNLIYSCWLHFSIYLYAIHLLWTFWGQLQKWHRTSPSLKICIDSCICLHFSLKYLRYAKVFIEQQLPLSRKKPETEQPTCLLSSDLEKGRDSKLAEICRDYWIFINFSGWFVNHVLSFPEKPRYYKAYDNSVLPLSCTALVCWFGYYDSCWKKLLDCWKLSCGVVH